jgi:hypothetical protein
MGRQKAAALDKTRRPNSRASGEAEPVPLGADGTVTVHLPMTFVRRSGRKRMLAPDGKPVAPAPRPAAAADTPVVRALARAFRWRKMIETGEHATVREIAEAECVNASYVSRVLRLTLLAPEILEEVLGAQVPDGLDDDLTVEVLLKPFPALWEEQMQTFSTSRLERPLCVGRGTEYAHGSSCRCGVYSASGLKPRA